MRMVTLYPVVPFPVVGVNDELPKLIARGLDEANIEPCDGDIIVVAQKVVSKSEGALVDLDKISASREAHILADRTGRRPELCQVYIDESQEILGTLGRHVICRHRLGFVCTAAGVDGSNVAAGNNLVTVLPLDPDASAQRIRAALRQIFGTNLAVVITDSFGRKEREGSFDAAIGLAGMAGVERRSQHDIFGRSMVAIEDVVDEVAGAAALLMGQGDEGTPVVLARGVSYTRDEHGCMDQLMTRAEDHPVFVPWLES